MPIIKSAQKRVRVAKKATIRNLRSKRSLKAALKAVNNAITSGKDAHPALQKANSELDKAVKKNILHKNKAARKKSQLAHAVKATGKKPAAKKAPAKKLAAKKAPAKKPAAKKSPAKK